MSFFTCHDQGDEGAQPASLRKVKRFHWMIQIGFDSFPLKQKLDKTFHQSTSGFKKPSCLLREIIYANHA